MTKKKRLAGTVSYTLTHTGIQPVHIQAKEHLKSLAERALSSKTIEDKVGLQRAYSAPDSIYVRGDTAYVAGTQISRMGENFRDIWDDVKIPFGQTKNTYRYEQLQKALAAHKEVRHMVGHSLGGATILEAAKTRPDLTTTTYGAPVFDIFTGSLLEKAPMRFANRWDPVAAFDSKAQTGFNGLGNPHAYDTFDHTSSGNSNPGYENPDGSVTLFE
jgi:pimeloyl-ACP methyl ester carboxylesterase